MYPLLKSGESHNHLVVYAGKTNANCKSGWFGMMGARNSFSDTRLYTCISVAKTSSSFSCDNFSAQSSIYPNAVFCLSASSKIESRYINLCQIFFTFSNMNSISVSLNPYRNGENQTFNFYQLLMRKLKP